jgi:hypothetical protein
MRWIAGALVFATACAEPIPQINPQAEAIARAIIDACPLADRNDQAARELCGQRLADNATLRDVMAEPFLWGGQDGDKVRLEDNHLTNFSPFVWRKLYLSTFMFPGEFSVEERDGLTIIHVPAVFRSELDIGAFPYPFWHSSKKWTSYQQAEELLLILDDGKLTGAMRSSVQDASRPTRDLDFDGNWTWTEDGQRQPFVTLYQYLLSPENPHVEELDAAYRNLEDKLRAQSCLACHSPDNASNMNPLELFSYPNQALFSRRRLVEQLEQNLMPPAVGITDDSERAEILSLAEQFLLAGDKALDFEGER